MNKSFFVVGSYSINMARIAYVECVSVDKTRAVVFFSDGLKIDLRGNEATQFMEHLQLL